MGECKRMLDYPHASLPLDLFSVQLSNQQMSCTGSSHLSSSCSLSSPRSPIRSSSHSHVLLDGVVRCGAARRGSMRRGVDVVKPPRGHRPLSPGPTAAGHGHCPPVYSRGISRTTREKTSPVLYGSIRTHGDGTVVVYAYSVALGLCIS